MHSAAGLLADHAPSHGSNDSASHSAATDSHAHDAHAEAQPSIESVEGPDLNHESGSHHCNCLSECCSIVLAQLVREEESFTAHVLSGQSTQVFTPHTIAAKSRVPHALPFANAPPETRLA